MKSRSGQSPSLPTPPPSQNSPLVGEQTAGMWSPLEVVKGSLVMEQIAFSRAPPGQACPYKSTRDLEKLLKRSEGVPDFTPLL